MEIYELQARYDSRKSFYGKAQVIETPKQLKLQSYDTIVATLDKTTHTLRVHDTWAAENGKYGHTTSRHIREFARQNDIDIPGVTRVGTFYRDSLPVVFRLLKDEVLAVFPTDTWQCADGDFLASYMHVGQHGPCSKNYKRFTKPAKRSQYLPLLRELKQIGYNNLVIS